MDHTKMCLETMHIHRNKAYVGNKFEIEFHTIYDGKWGAGRQSKEIKKKRSMANSEPMPSFCQAHTHSAAAAMSKQNYIPFFFETQAEKYKRFARHSWVSVCLRDRCTCERVCPLYVCTHCTVCLAWCTNTSSA